MPSQDKARPPGYLRGIMTCGARPFRYRGGVRRLLGMPETGSGGIMPGYKTPLPGFEYLRSLCADARRSRVSLRESDAPSMHDAEGKGKSEDRSLKGENGSEAMSLVLVPGAFERCPEESSERIEYESPRAATPDHSRKATSPMPLGKGQIRLRQAGVDTEATALKLRDISVRQAECPVLPAPLREYDTAGRVQADGGPDHGSQVPKGCDISARAEDIPVGSKAGALSGASLIERSVVAAPREDASVSDIATAAGFFKGMLPRPDPVMSSAAGSGGQEADTGDIHGFAAAMPHMRGADQAGAFERIERLRSALHEMAARNTEHKVEEPADKPAPTPVMHGSPHPQRVVVLQRPAQRGRVIPAFWERSYLGRLHLRILR